MATEVFDNADDGLDAVVVRQRPRDGSSDNNALTVRFEGTAGLGHALRIVSKNATAATLSIEGDGEALSLGGPQTIRGVSGTPEVFPLGAASALSTGLNILSSFDGGEDEGLAGQFDSTGRLNLYSYQRADVGSYGENIRRFLMRENAKSMDAWYLARENGQMGPGYDGNGDPDSDARWVPVAWVGAHWKSNDGLSIHGHWSIEVPDSTGAVQTRFEVPYTDQEAADGSKILGVDVTNIQTNLADLTVRATNGQVLRVGAGNAHNKDILLSASAERATSGRRWAIRANSTTEAGANAGTDFQLLNYDDSGTLIGTTIGVERATGNVILGAAPPGALAKLHIAPPTNKHGVLVKPALSQGSNAAYAAVTTATTDRILDVRITGDGLARLVEYSDGKMEWGDGTNSRDTNLYRASANVLATDDSLMVAGKALGTPQAADQGFLAWNGDPTNANSSAAGTSGTVYLMQVPVVSTATTAKVWFIIGGTAAATVTTAEIGLYNSSGTLLGSADISSIITTNNVLRSVTLAVAVTPGLYWVGIVVNASTMPTLCRPNAVTAAQLNANLSVSAARYAVNGTAQATLPASVTPASNDVSGNIRGWWVGVS